MLLSTASSIQSPRLSMQPSSPVKTSIKSFVSMSKYTGRIEVENISETH